MVEKLLTNWLSICLYAFLKVRSTVHHLGASPWLWSLKLIPKSLRLRVGHRMKVMRAFSLLNGPMRGPRQDSAGKGRHCAPSPAHC